MPPLRSGQIWLRALARCAREAVDDRVGLPILVPNMIVLRFKRVDVSRSAMALWILAAPGAMAGAQAPSSCPAAGRSGPPAPFEVPSWAFPSPAPTPPAAIDSVLQLHVPRSLATYTAAQVRDRLAVPDWHPEGHPRMPSVVAIGRKPGLYACAFCHLADGAGRPENAMLAGLPAAYIVQQVADIKSSARRSACLGPYLPSDAMRTVADSATPAEVAAAARYLHDSAPGSARVWWRWTVSPA